MRRAVFLAATAVASLLGGLLCTSVAEAEVTTENVEYAHGDTLLEGFLAYDDALEGPRPGVLIVHQWMGLTENEMMRARMLAELGYVALAADIYGKGVRPANQDEAAALAGKHRADRPLLRARVQAGLDMLKQHELVDSAQVAAIGYCFGGGVVLELARSGAELNAVISFHGNLDTPEPDDAKDIKCKLLVCHGADDPFVPAEQVAAFMEEMRGAGVDWQFIAYGGAVHSFTQEEAGHDNSRGAAYNQSADRRSWQAMLQLLGEVFD